MCRQPFKTTVKNSGRFSIVDSLNWSVAQGTANRPRGHWLLNSKGNGKKVE